MDIDQQQPEDIGFDLEGYISNYTGHGKIDRLIFIADKTKGTPLEIEALKMAVDELKNTSNIKAYRDVTSQLEDRAGPEYAYNADWAAEVDNRTEQHIDQLESELTTARTNLVKESIRLGHLALGEVLYESGDLQGAFKQYMRTRDYCTMPRHVIQMCLQIIRCSLETKNFMHVANYVQKAESTPEAKDDPLVAGKLTCAQGLSLMSAGKYKQAALKFTEVPPELGSQYNEVLSPGDVATYGGLCALAMFDRGSLKARAIENARFRDYMDAAPEMRDAIQYFYNSKYTDCLNLLERIKGQLVLDVWLKDHVGPLYSAIRARALKQYAAPFSALDLTSMAAAFNTNVEGLTQEIVALIGSKDITARIDSHNKILYARKADQRAATYRQVLLAGEEHVRATKALLLRASMLRFNLVQRPMAAVSAVPERQEGPMGGGGRGARQRERKGHGGSGGGKGELASFAALAGNRGHDSFGDDMM